MTDLPPEPPSSKSLFPATGPEAMNDAGALEAKLAALRLEHRDLDQVLDRVIEKAPFDQLQLQRLKKRKLMLKDQILQLESQLIPDIIA
jgi:hypothetical protein